MTPLAMLATALLISACGGSSKSLIPSGNAGPLRRDFEAVAAAAAKGDGNCKATNAAISKMNRHFAALPHTIDVALREKLEEGIENLSAKALALCEQPSASTTSTRTSEVITPPTTTTHTSTVETEETEPEVEETETLSTSSNGGTEPTEEEVNPEEVEAESGGTGAEAPIETPPAGHGGPGGGTGAP